MLCKSFAHRVIHRYFILSNLAALTRCYSCDNIRSVEDHFTSCTRTFAPSNALDENERFFGNKNAHTFLYARRMISFAESDIDVSGPNKCRLNFSPFFTFSNISNASFWRGPSLRITRSEEHTS